jgi:hypothetical protein
MKRLPFREISIDRLKLLLSTANPSLIAAVTITRSFDTCYVTFGVSRYCVRLDYFTFAESERNYANILAHIKECGLMNYRNV